MCASNGRTYPSACVARCLGFKDHQFVFGFCHVSNPCTSKPCLRNQRYDQHMCRWCTWWWQWCQLHLNEHAQHFPLFISPVSTVLSWQSICIFTAVVVIRKLRSACQHGVWFFPLSWSESSFWSLLNLSQVSFSYTIPQFTSTVVISLRAGVDPTLLLPLNLVKHGLRPLIHQAMRKYLSWMKTFRRQKPLGHCLPGLVDGVNINSNLMTYLIPNQEYDFTFYLLHSIFPVVALDLCSSLPLWH